MFIMGRIPKEKIYTRKQLQGKINFFRRMLPILAKGFGTPKTLAGKWMTLDTEVGPVKVLAYNLEDKRKLPLFVNIHGSGFTMGDATMDDPFMMNIARNANVKILSVDYSLSPEVQFPVAVNECYSVLKYAKEHPDEFGIDPDNIAVGGHSAGGNFTASICIRESGNNTLGVKCAILDYPPTDVYTDPYLKPRHKKSLPPPSMARIFDPAYCHNKEDRKNPLVSPYFATQEQLKNFPPTLVITAELDMLGPETEELKDRMIEAGVNVTFKRFDGAVHGFNLKLNDKDADESWRMMIDFLNKYLHGESV